MVDSSLQNADKVHKDDQQLKGELWIMRHAHWFYWPLEVEIVYHVVHGLASVLVFHYRDHTEPRQVTDWQAIVDTRVYRDLLTEADRKRAELP